MNQTISCDVAILGGGLGGLFAAIGAGERVLDEAYLRDGQEVANRTKGKVYDGLYALDTLREIWDDNHNGEPLNPVEKIPGQQAAERKG